MLCPLLVSSNLPLYRASCYGLPASGAKPRRLGRSAWGPLITSGSYCGEVLGWLFLQGGRSLQADGREERCHWHLLLLLCFFPCCCSWKRHLEDGIHSWEYTISINPCTVYTSLVNIFCLRGIFFPSEWCTVCWSSYTGGVYLYISLYLSLAITTDK